MPEGFSVGLQSGAGRNDDAGSRSLNLESALLFVWQQALIDKENSVEGGALSVFSWFVSGASQLPVLLFSPLQELGKTGGQQGRAWVSGRGGLDSRTW
jgi:hypothetical protein